MSAISYRTRASIKAYLEVFIENLVEKYRKRNLPSVDGSTPYLKQKSSKGRLKPFHAAIISPEMLRLNEFERGFSTSLGTTFEECAKLIAFEHHREAHRSYDITGEVSQAAINEIERQIAIFEISSKSQRQKPSLEEMIQSVFNARKDDDLVTRTSRADLYILTKEGKHLFFEIKSPQPNKGQCFEVTQRLLRFHLLSAKNYPRVEAYYAMAYNNFGPNRSDYKNSLVKTYTPFDDSVIIGQEFWHIVGGETAYEELLEIYEEVGREKSKYIIDALAFGF
ncbi:TdeIII family type II restriction endonuclease [Ancylothrix sp. C2]|uniref:TdeIII family type II restriction endonuclease n=1 Tax=Ancylothrix sp. D3o TaxID=2953691 RepID=UPI0021BAE504|nr:TdeIII family type II restriction endonuclease [Ancylothrix sp. D3o]MCT7950375.1 TdeIII family type II restriction endonuclease [Ancylothrix sp. D3o]